MPFLCLPDERTHSSSSFSFPYLSPTRVTGRGCVWGLGRSSCTPVGARPPGHGGLDLRRPSFLPEQSRGPRWSRGPAQWWSCHSLVEPRWMRDSCLAGAGYGARTRRHGASAPAVARHGRGYEVRHAGVGRMLAQAAGDVLGRWSRVGRRAGASRAMAVRDRGGVPPNPEEKRTAAEWSV